MSFLNGLVALLGVVLSLVALSRARKAEEGNAALHKVTEELRKHQLERLQREDRENVTPRLQVAAAPIQKQKFTLRVTNIGKGIGNKVQYELLQLSEGVTFLVDGTNSVAGTASAVVDTLGPSQSTEINALVFRRTDTQRTLTIRLRWSSDDGRDFMSDTVLII